MLNYAIDPAILMPYVPHGTELDLYEGEAYVSIVAFLFCDTRVLGIPVPFHRNFEEVNLRFYIRRRTAIDHDAMDDGVDAKRAVAFIQELVPKPAIAFLARALYNEKYLTARMAHRIEENADRTTAFYSWARRGKEHTLTLTATGEPQPLQAGSLDQFIAEHYWGYAQQRDGSTVEYAVEHPAWRIRHAASYELNWRPAELYGPEFARVLAGPPRSVFLAEGSAVSVSMGKRIPVSQSGLSVPPPSRLPTKAPLSH